MNEWDKRLSSARALGHPARVTPLGDLPEHVLDLAEAVQAWATREMEQTGRKPHQLIITTAVGEVMIGPVEVVSPEQLAAMVSVPPSPMDDLFTGMRVLTDAYWTRGEIPDDVRARMRAWIHGAQLLLADRYSTAVDA